MEIIIKELWIKNYRGEGDCADLEKYLKTLDYGSRTGVSYLPWAVVERIFKLQGGKTEIIQENSETIVFVDSITKEEYSLATGEIVHTNVNCYFIKVEAVWNGEKHTERYPLQDSNGKPLAIWTQNDLNKACQRAKVKAIAIVSGIGYKLFEDGDLQFNEDGENKPATPAEVKEKSVKETLNKRKENTPTPTSKKPADDYAEVVKSDIPVPPTDAVDAQIAKDEQNDTLPSNIAPYEETVTVLPSVASEENRTEMIEFVKTKFMAGSPEIQSKIKGFLTSKGVKKMQDLQPNDLVEIYNSCK
jgi:hypothetical protein